MSFILVTLNFIVLGLCTAYITERITSSAYFHILLGRLSCDIQCYNHDAWKSQGICNNACVHLLMMLIFIDVIHYL